jgi:hypothetical protein
MRASGLWHQGVLLESATDDLKEQHEFGAPSLKDEYIFLAKILGNSWASFALLLRFATFENFFKELRHFYLTKGIKK